MTLKELHRIWDIELDKLNISSYPSFLPEEKDYWINASTQRFIKTRYSGLNAHRAGFQQNQKRSDDLRTVTKTVEYKAEPFDWLKSYSVDDIVISRGIYYKCITDEAVGDIVTQNWTQLSNEENRLPIQYPLDYVISVGEFANIGTFSITEIENGRFTPSNVKVMNRNDITEATIENFDSKFNSSISSHLFHNGSAKPIRVFTDNEILLYTDSNYYIVKYGLTYIFLPAKIDTYMYPTFNQSLAYSVGDKVLYNGQHYVCKNDTAGGAFSIDNFEEIKIITMPEHTWDEILVGAVRLALENISESRYQTYASESQATE